MRLKTERLNNKTMMKHFQNDVPGPKNGWGTCGSTIKLDQALMEFKDTKGFRANYRYAKNKRDIYSVAFRQ
jgi:hypothetical protein